MPDLEHALERQDAVQGAKTGKAIYKDYSFNV